MKLQELNKKEKQQQQIDSAVLEKYNEYSYILDNSIDDYSKFCMYMNQNEGYEFKSLNDLN